MSGVAVIALYPTAVKPSGQFVGPLQALGNSVVTQVKSTRCLGIEIDSDLNWNVHVKELIKSLTQKLNLLRSLYFLPTSARADFFRVNT